MSFGEKSVPFWKYRSVTRARTIERVRYAHDGKKITESSYLREQRERVVTGTMDDAQLGNVVDMAIS